MGRYLNIAHEVLAKMTKNENDEQKVVSREEQMINDPLVKYALDLFQGEIISIESKDTALNSKEFQK